MSYRIRARRIIFAIIPLIALVLLTITSDIDMSENVLRAQPFFLMWVAKVLMVIVLLAQHPGPYWDQAWFRFWEWIDPVTIVLVFMFAGSGLYYFLLWVGHSENFTVSVNVYHVSRLLLWIDGYLSSVVAMEMIAWAIEARKKRRKRRPEFYDTTKEGKDG